MAAIVVHITTGFGFVKNADRYQACTTVMLINGQSHCRDQQQKNNNNMTDFLKHHQMKIINTTKK